MSKLFFIIPIMPCRPYGYIAIMMAMGNALQAVVMVLRKEYVEKYDWLVKEFTDRAFPLSAA